MSVWKSIQRPETGFLQDISESIGLLEQRHSGVLADTSDGEMLISSDYSGQHRRASHECYCFLVTTSESAARWEHIRATIRQQYLPDGRHIEFKKLRERTRMRALIPFLDGAEALAGNLFCFIVDKRIPSLFKAGGACTAADIPDIFHPSTSPTTVEKMLRVSHFLALLVAGLRREDQRAIWISDRDEVLEDYDRRDRLGTLIMSLVWGLTGWRSPALLEFGTTALEQAGSTRLEDLVAIPDLVAGALCDAVESMPGYGGQRFWVKPFEKDSVSDRRTRPILHWLGRQAGGLKRMILWVEADRAGGIRTSAQLILNLPK